MGRVREIPRTAAFAWSPDVANLSLATGTRAGAVDVDFSSDTKLELWALDVENKEGDDEIVKPVGSVATDSRFYDIAWSRADNGKEEGIIAGALENGSLDLWDASKLRAGTTDALISSTSKHNGPIKTLQFNPHRPSLLATSGTKGELYITDLNNPTNPYRLGTGAARADDFDALDWNKQVSHILATAGSGGFVTVWDVKAKKESLTLNNYGRKAVSSIAWNPDLPTKLATAVFSDQDPLILMWDLRNSSAPERILKGHEQGVLSLSWCRQDSNLLLSCGKDNRNICWNPHTGEQIGEFPIVTNWTFQTAFNPQQPNFLATASFDGKVAIHTLQNTNGKADQSSTATAQADDGADFFAKAHSAPSGSYFSLAKAPKWLQRPVGASFGFPGKLVRYSLNADAKGSKLKISTFASDPSVETSISQFAQDLKEDNLTKVCDAKVAAADSEAQKTDWKIMSTLLSESPRKGLLTYLGFSETAPTDSETKEEATDKGLEPPAETNGESKANNRLSSFFDNVGDSHGFLADLAASKGARTNNPFHIYTGSESEAEKQISRHIMLGAFEQAMDICLKENRMSDAFMIAVCGGQTCIDKAQAAYFAQQSNGPNYLRLLASVVGKNLWDVVYNADLANWTEVMATLCTFADETEFSDLSEALGDRLDETTDSRVHAAFCYLAGSKLEKVVPIWLAEMQEVERNGAATAGDESSFSVHVQALQYFIEKVAIFRKATSYEDKESREEGTAWKLEPLYTKYAEYAEVVAAYGHLDLADQYLKLLPAKYPAAEVARDRVLKATKKSASQAAQSTTTPAARNGVPATPLGAPSFAASTYASQPTPQPAVARGYAPPAFQPAYQPNPSPYGPGANFTDSNTYQPNNSASGPSLTPSVGPPPSGPSRAAAANGSNWNDLPDGFANKPTPSRRGTPGLATAPVNSPFANQSSYSSAVPKAPSSFQQRAATPLGPPPKAGAPPRVSSPLADGRAAQSMDLNRPSSSAANSYAPPASTQPPNAFAPPTSIPSRGASPYNPPPSAAPSSNRYTPAPGSQISAPVGGARPPVAQRPIAPNTYAPQQSSLHGPSQYGATPPQPSSQFPSQGPPPASRPPTGPPPSGPPPNSRGTPQQQASKTSTLVSSKYPPGDRSHIPPESQQIYVTLNTEMQRIKGLAPSNFKQQVDGCDKRLNVLYDALNNDDINAEHVLLLKQYAQALTARDFDAAQQVHVTLMKQVESAGPWMIGIKNLIIMSKATPM